MMYAGLQPVEALRSLINFILKLPIINGLLKELKKLVDGINKVGGAAVALQNLKESAKLAKERLQLAGQRVGSIGDKQKWNDTRQKQKDLKQRRQDHKNKRAQDKRAFSETGIHGGLSLSAGDRKAMTSAATNAVKDAKQGARDKLGQTKLGQAMSNAKQKLADSKVGQAASAVKQKATDVGNRARELKERAANSDLAKNVKAAGRKLNDAGKAVKNLGNKARKGLGMVGNKLTNNAAGRKLGIDEKSRAAKAGAATKGAPTTPQQGAQGGTQPGLQGSPGAMQPAAAPGYQPSDAKRRADESGARQLSPEQQASREKMKDNSFYQRSQERKAATGKQDALDYMRQASAENSAYNPNSLSAGQTPPVSQSELNEAGRPTHSHFDEQGNFVQGHGSKQLAAEDTPPGNTSSLLSTEETNAIAEPAPTDVKVDGNTNMGEIKTGMIVDTSELMKQLQERLKRVRVDDDLSDAGDL